MQAVLILGAEGRVYCCVCMCLFVILDGLIQDAYVIYTFKVFYSKLSIVMCSQKYLLIL